MPKEDEGREEDILDNNDGDNTPPDEPKDDIPADDQSDGGSEPRDIPADDLDDSGDDKLDSDDGYQPPQEGASRASRRVQALANERKVDRERAERAEAEVARLSSQMAEVQRQLSSGRSAQEAQAEAELLANMDPIQRVQYEADKKIAAIQREVAATRVNALDAQDRAVYYARAENNKLLKQYGDKVEKALSEMRAKGINANRMEIYYYLLGKETHTRKEAGEGNPAARREAQRRINSSQGRPSSARSDAPAGRGGRSLEDRLADMSI